MGRGYNERKNKEKLNQSGVFIRQNFSMDADPPAIRASSVKFPGAGITVIQIAAIEQGKYLGINAMP